MTIIIYSQIHIYTDSETDYKDFLKQKKSTETCNKSMKSGYKALSSINLMTRIQGK